MVCSAQPWAPLSPLPPCSPCDLQPGLPIVELPHDQAEWRPLSPFDAAMATLPLLPTVASLPLPPLPAVDEQLLSFVAPAATASQLLPSASGSDRSAKLEEQMLLSFVAPAATASQLLPSSSGSDRSAKLEKRMERMRAKNRRAQAKYREKQKAKQQQFELQYAGIAAELEEARQLNAELRTAVAVQEAVKINREVVETILQAAAGQQPAAAGSQHSCSDACSCGVEGAAACWERQPFSLRVQMYSSMGRKCEPMRQLLDQCGGAPDSCSLEPSTSQDQCLTPCVPEVIRLVQATTVAHMMQEWSAFCEFASEVASAVDSGQLQESEGEERVQSALEYIAVMKHLMHLHKCDTYRQLLLSTRLPGETEDAARARWRQAALAMRVTREQAESMLPHYQLYLKRQAELGAELVGGMEALQLAQQELAAKQEPLHGTLSGIASEYIALFEAGGAVEHQMRSATFILHDFMCTSGRVLTALQKARAVRCCMSDAGSSGQRTTVYPDLVAITREILYHHSLLEPEE